MDSFVKLLELHFASRKSGCFIKFHADHAMDINSFIFKQSVTQNYRIHKLYCEHQPFSMEL